MSGRQSRKLRTIIILIASFTFLLVLALLLWFTEQLISLKTNLENQPDWVSWLVIMLFASAGLLFAVLLWRLLRTPVPAGTTHPPDTEVDETRIRQQAEQLTRKGVELEQVSRELEILDQRRQQSVWHVAFFGTISSGKSSLINALCGNPSQPVAVTGGTTQTLRQVDWKHLDNGEVVLTDMPGINEVSGVTEQLSCEEAVRAHIVVYVTDSDITRGEFEILSALAALHKPLVIAINKADRYSDNEMAMLRAQLQQRLLAVSAVNVVAVNAGHSREVLVQTADGHEQYQVRPVPPQTGELEQALQQLLSSGGDELEEKLDHAILVQASEKLDNALQAHRAKDAKRIVERHSVRAVIGAMAAVSPGSDLIIQGAVAVSLVKSLSALYEIPVKQMDTDRLIELAQQKLGRKGTVVMLIAGNGFKAFPGVGTLVGGAIHAVAYGLVFQSLGRSVAQTLEQDGCLKPDVTAERFGELMSEDLAGSAKHFAKLVLEHQKRSRKT